MKRQAIETLQAWKKDPRRKPLLLDGARQTGKTWLLKEFGRTCFRSMAYVSLDKSKAMRESFAMDSDAKRLLEDLSLASGTRIVPGETLVVVDEIQTSPAAITALKYFCEDTPEVAVAAAGSLLGLSANWGSGFPVGKTETVRLHPMTFAEFLEAMGDGGLSERLAARDWETLGRFGERMERRVRQYAFVGGMPAAVEAFAAGADWAGARREQRRILADYRRDFAKHAPREVVERIRLVWDSVPRQLGRENRKFVFGAVREGGRGRDFEEAIEWLRDAGLVAKVQAVSKPGIPLAAYTTSAFKVFGLDVGLLGGPVRVGGLHAVGRESRVHGVQGRAGRAIRPTGVAGGGRVRAVLVGGGKRDERGGFRGGVARRPRAGGGQGGKESAGEKPAGLHGQVRPGGRRESLHGGLSPQREVVVVAALRGGEVEGRTRRDGIMTRGAAGRRSEK